MEMEVVDRIEWKAKKLVKWCNELAVEGKENHEHSLFQESHGLIVDHIWPLAINIGDLRVDYAHGVNITQGIRKLKQEFNLIFNLYEDLSHLYNDSYRPRRAGCRHPLRPRQ